MWYYEPTLLLNFICIRTMENKKHSFLDMMSPTQVFVFGIVEGILVLCTIGFFILLGITLGDGGSSGGRVVSGDAGARVAAPSANAGAGNISLREVDEENDHIRGKKDAPITLVEYSDFECPFCGRFAPTVEQVLEKYPDDVRIVYRHFPLRSIHPQAAPAAVASECAAEQGKFWEFHDALFANQSGLSRTFYVDTARALGLNVANFETCIDENRYADVVQADEVDAQAAGGQGTPYSIIVGPNGELIPVNGAQPFEAVDAAIQQVL